MRKKVLKSGVAGKTYEFPSTLTLHTSPELIGKWIDYSVLDSESTFFLREALESKLFHQYRGIEKPEIRSIRRLGKCMANIRNVLETFWITIDRYGKRRL